MAADRRLFEFSAKAAFTLTALLFTVLLLWVAGGYPLRARYVPQMVALFALVCLVIQFLMDTIPPLGNFYSKVEKKAVFMVDDQVKETRAGDDPEFSLELVAYFWLGLLLTGLYLLGFLVFIPVYVLLYLRFQAALNWTKSAIYGLSTWLFVYLLFVRLFEIRLYAGLLIEPLFDF